jgi:hypothetical protein
MNGISFDSNIVVQGLAILQLITIVLVMIIWFALANTKKRVKGMLKGNSMASLEDVIIKNQEQIHALQQQVKSQEHENRRIHELISGLKGKMGVLRYNAFATEGSDLSFSVALVDDSKNGVVITGIHSRDHTYIYAKPVENGSSSYTLTPEEKEAIEKAGKS